MAGSTVRSLTVALRTDATGMGPGFKEAQAQTQAYTQQVAESMQRLRDARKMDAGGTDAGAQAKTETVQAMQYRLEYYKFLQNQAAQEAVLETKKHEQFVQIGQQMAAEDAANRTKLLSGLQENIKNRLAAQDDAAKREQEIIEAEWRKQAVAQTERQKAEEDAAERMLNYRQQFNQEMLESDERARHQQQSERAHELAALEENIKSRFAIEDENARKMQALNAQFEQNEARAWLGGSRSEPHGGSMDIFPGEAAASGAGGAGRMMGEGWMRRMAGMDLARAAGNAVVPGLGDQVGMAAYFAMGGGASMMALGGTVAIVATIGSRINDWREGIKAAEEEQAKFSAEVEKSAQGYRIMASQTEGFGKLGDSMLSDMKQSRDSAIDAQANLAVAQAEFHAAWINDSAERVRLEFAQKRADTASGADLITGLLFRGPGISNDPLMQSIRGLVGQGGMQDIERARMQQDVGIAQMTEGAITTGADWAANLSAMHSGPLREQLENQAAAVAKRRELLDQEYKDQIEYQRKRQDAGIQVGSDFLKANIGNTGYNLQSDPAYQAQLAATQGAIDLQYQQTQITERENQKRADDDAQTAANRLELQKQDFDLQQQYSLNRTQISGIADSNLRRAAEQREANAETMEKLKLEGYTTEQLDQQRRINDQITLNLEKEVWYQERLFDLEMKRADVEHELAGIQATRTQEQTAFGAANSAWENQRRLDEARGMSRAAQQDQLQVENNQAIDAQNQADFKSQEAAKARTLAADKERAAAMTAQRFGPNSDAARQAANEARTAQDQARQAQLEADGLHQQAIDAGKKWQTDKQALEIEHQRAVQNEIQSTLDASAVAEGRMSRLQAERREFEREHPDERSPAELDRLYAAKKAELDAEFGRSLKEKELQLAERRGWLMPQEADYLRLKLENPDVSDGLLRMMSVLDQLSQGEMSTRYTMGQTDFGALRGGVSFGGGGSMWDPNMAFAAARNAAMGSFGGGDFGAFGGGSFGAFDGGPLIGSRNPMISATNPMISRTNPMTFMAGSGTAGGTAQLQSDGPFSRTNAILQQILRAVERNGPGLN